MSKPFWKAKRFWGVALAAVPVVGPALSGAVLSLPAETTPNALTGLCDVSGLPAEWQGIASVCGVLLWAYGQYKATGQITLK